MNSDNEIDLTVLAGHLAALCNGTASDSEIASLNEVLLASEAARRFACDFFKDECLLREELCPCNVPADFHRDLAIPLMQLARETSDELSTSRDSRQSEAKTNPCSANNEATGAPDSTERTWLRFPSPVLLMGAAVVGVLLISVSVFLSKKPERVPGGQLIANHATSKTEVAEHVTLAGCRGAVQLKNGGLVAPGETIPVGVTIGVADGLAELRFQCGARVVLKSPASLRVASSRRAVLERGTLTASVEESAHGFRIDTPTTLVTDLGTEFGVSVVDNGDTDVVVFAGEVAIQSQEASAEPEEHLDASRDRGRLLVEGEGVRIKGPGDLKRLIAINSFDYPRRIQEYAPLAVDARVIQSVTDNLRDGDTTKCYQIIHGGFREDAVVYVDRNYQWNGLDKKAGIPPFLIGGDYIMPFNDDKLVSRLEVTVGLAQPARVFVLFDNRASLPKWLVERFTDTGFDIGVDEGPRIGPKGKLRLPDLTIGVGPGNSIDETASIWCMDVTEPGEITLGSLDAPDLQKRWAQSMYGIVAIPLSRAERLQPR